MTKSATEVMLPKLCLWDCHWPSQATRTGITEGTENTFITKYLFQVTSLLSFNKVSYTTLRQQAHMCLHNDFLMIHVYCVVLLYTTDCELFLYSHHLCEPLQSWISLLALHRANEWLLCGVAWNYMREYRGHQGLFPNSIQRKQIFAWEVWSGKKPALQ